MANDTNGLRNRVRRGAFDLGGTLTTTKRQPNVERREAETQRKIKAQQVSNAKLRDSRSNTSSFVKQLGKRTSKGLGSSAIRSALSGKGLKTVLERLPANVATKAATAKKKEKGLAARFPKVIRDFALRQRKAAVAKRKREGKSPLKTVVPIRLKRGRLVPQKGREQLAKEQGFESRTFKEFRTGARPGGNPARSPAQLVVDRAKLRKAAKRALSGGRSNRSRSDRSRSRGN